MARRSAARLLLQHEPAVAGQLIIAAAAGYSYLNRRLDVLVDRTGKAISLGLC